MAGLTACPDHRDRIFWILFFAIFVAMLGIGAIAPTMPIYAETLGASGLWLGMIYASFSISRLIFMPLAGNWSDLRGRKVFLLSGLALYAFSSLGYIWADSVIRITMVRFVHGIGSAMVIPIATAIVGDISPDGREGRMMGNFQAGLFLGFGAGPFLGGLLMQWQGINQVFLVMGGMSLLSFLLILFLLPEIKSSPDRKMSSPGQFRHRHLWDEPLFHGLFAFRFTNAVGRAAILSFLPIFADRLNIDTFQIGILVSLNIVLTAVLQKFTGAMADRYSRIWLIVTGNLVAAVSIVWLPFTQTFTELVLMGILMGTGSAVAFPAASAIATTLGRKHGMGHVMGQFNMAMSIGSIIGALSAGWLIDLFNMRMVFVMNGVLGVAGSLFCFVAMRRESSRTAD